MGYCICRIAACRNPAVNTVTGTDAGLCCKGSPCSYYIMDRTIVGEAVTLGDFLDSSNCFCVPLFQRAYSWQHAEVSRFIKDLWQAHGTANRREVFIGSLVTQSDGQGSRCFNLIDGQQRFTTVNLMLIALREVFKLANLPVLYFDKQLLTSKVRHRCHMVKASPTRVCKQLVQADLGCFLQDPDSPLVEAETQPVLTLGQNANKLFHDLAVKAQVFDEICHSRQNRKEEEM